MTAQLAETVFYGGEDLAMFATPLDRYFEMKGEGRPFAPKSTALRRGYMGRWEIADGRLYLVSLRGFLPDGSEVSLKDVFPEASGRVFAFWFSGVIRIPRGNLLRYIHGGFASVFEKEQVIEFDKGFVVSDSIHENSDADFRE